MGSSPVAVTYSKQCCNYWTSPLSWENKETYEWWCVWKTVHVKCETENKETSSNARERNDCTHKRVFWWYVRQNGLCGMAIG